MNVPEEMAQEHISGMTIKTWKKINQHVITSSPLLRTTHC